MPQIQRKHDKWMIPAVVVMLPVLFAGVVSWAVWAKATDKDIKAVKTSVEVLDTYARKTGEHVSYLLKCEGDSRARNSNVETKIDNMTDIVDDIQTKQEKILDMIIRILENGKPSGYGRTD